jgi:hypothetical protein
MEVASENNGTAIGPHTARHNFEMMKGIHGFWEANNNQRKQESAL